MSGRLDDAALDELRALAEGATPGPWAVSDDPEHAAELYGYADANGDEVFEVSRERTFNESAAVDGRADAAYIATASPDVVTALVGEVVRLRATVARVSEVHRPAAPDEAACVGCWHEYPCPTADALRDALDVERHTETPDASQAVRSAPVAAEGHVGAENQA